jgi:hypothetical protein
MDMAIGQLIALYCLGGRQGNRKQNDNTNFAGHFDGCCGALVQHRAHCPMDEVKGLW